MLGNPVPNLGVIINEMPRSLEQDWFTINKKIHQVAQHNAIRINMDYMGGILWYVRDGAKLGILLVNVTIQVYGRNVDTRTTNVMTFWRNHS
jgi:hypothetical protein